MHTTRLSFLGRLNQGDNAAWQELEAVYTPLLRRWLHNNALTAEDVEDLVQEVKLFLLNNLGNFEHNTRTGAFRKWLRSVTVNIARNYLRKVRPANAKTGDFESLLDQLDDASSRASIAFERDYQQALLRQLLRRVESDFYPDTLSMFRQYVLKEDSVADTANAHRVSKAAVYLAKSKVLRRLREEYPEDFEP